MTTPARYPYNPGWGLIAFLGAIGVAALLDCSLRSSSWLEGTLGSLFSLTGLLLASRRLVFPRSLELGPDALLLPSGFLRARVARIPYADIEWSRDTMLPMTQVLQVRTKTDTFEIVSSMLSDAETFAKVLEVLHARVVQVEEAHPRPRPPVEGSGYVLRCSYHGNGLAYEPERERTWRFETLREDGPNRRYPYGLFRLPDFVVHDEKGDEWLRIRRDRRFPLARFVMLERGAPVGTLRQRSPLLNRYRLEFAQGPSWRFHMPLFSVNFTGVSDAGRKVRARLWSHTEWHVRVDPEADSPYLLAALAFIHRERLRCV